MTTIECCNCDAPATRFLDADADYDPRCEACYEREFVACGNCDAIVLRSEVEVVEVTPASRDCPAEGEERCVRCFEPDRDDDCDDVDD